MNEKLAALIETVLRESGKLLSSEEVLEECEKRGVALVPEYIDVRSTPRAAVQDALERLAALPGSAVRKWVSGPVTTFQWVTKPNPYQLSFLLPCLLQPVSLLRSQLTVEKSSPAV